MVSDLCCGSDGKESACNVGDPGLIPGLGRSLGEGNGNPLQYSCLENSMDRGAWRAIVHGVTRNWTGLTEEHFHFHFHLTHRRLDQKSGTIVFNALTANSSIRGTW